MTSSHDVLRVVYKVDRGVVRKLVGLKINGNKYFSDELLRERMNVRPAAGFLTHGVFSQSLLADDVSSVANLYKSNGFLDAKVSSKVTNGVGGIDGDMSVAIDVEEGTQTRVGSLKIVGSKAITADALRERIQLTDNQPFSESKLAEDRDVIRHLLLQQRLP